MTWEADWKDRERNTSITAERHPIFTAVILVGKKKVHRGVMYLAILANFAQP